MKKVKLNSIAPFYVFPGKRLDQVLAHLFQEYSRSYLKNLILNNKVFVNDKIEFHPDKKIFGGEKLVIFPISEKFHFPLPENIFLNIIYEDHDILVLNKPIGIIVHPGAGNPNGTILNALLYHYKMLNNLPRAGIVHRLDKNTSGLMVIAKNINSYKYLINVLKKREIVREYQAIVKGRMISGGIVNAPIMRHPKKRICMIVHNLGKKAITHYKIIYRFQNYTHILLRLDSGRTHQIRVHMLYLGYPILGDPLYCRGSSFLYYNNIKMNDCKKINNFSRQALHSSSLAFYHPITKKFMRWTITLPEDMINLLKCL